MQGIDVYSEALMGRDVVEVESRWSAFRSELLLWIVRNKVAQRVDSSLVASHAREWIRERRDDRFATLVHLYTTHTPYDPPERWRRRYTDPAYDGPVDRFHADHRRAIERGEWTPSAADEQQIRALYAGGVSWADEMIGGLLAELETHGLTDDTVVVITSDHGESLGEHGLWEHDHMFQDNLLVPLLIAAPGRLPEGARVPAPVSSIDVFPTVLDVLGLEVAEVPDGAPESQIDGQSLVPLARGDVASVRPVSFTESAAAFAAQSSTHKLILLRDAAVEADELPDTALFFDLAADPLEERNAVRDLETEARALRTALAAWTASLPEPRFDVDPTPPPARAGGAPARARLHVRRRGQTALTSSRTWSAQRAQRVGRERTGRSPVSSGGLAELRREPLGMKLVGLVRRAAAPRDLVRRRNAARAFLDATPAGPVRVDERTGFAIFEPAELPPVADLLVELERVHSELAPHLDAIRNAQTGNRRLTFDLLSDDRLSDERAFVDFALATEVLRPVIEYLGTVPYLGRVIFGISRALPDVEGPVHHQRFPRRHRRPAPLAGLHQRRAARRGGRSAHLPPGRRQRPRVARAAAQRRVVPDLLRRRGLPTL